MFTHNTANPPIHKWLRMCKPLLERSAKAKDIGSKIQICTKQPRNLKTILGGYREKTRVSQNVPANAGCSKCVKNCKVSCPMMKEGKTFKSTRTKRTYPIRQNVDCDSEYLSLLIKLFNLIYFAIFISVNLFLLCLFISLFLLLLFTLKKSKHKM